MASQTPPATTGRVSPELNPQAPLPPPSYAQGFHLMVVLLTPPCSGPHDPSHDPALKAELPTILFFVFTEAWMVWYMAMSLSITSPCPPRLRSTQPLSESHYVLCMLGNILVTPVTIACAWSELRSSLCKILCLPPPCRKWRHLWLGTQLRAEPNV